MTGEESAAAPAKPAERMEEKRPEEKRPEEKRPEEKKKGSLWGWVARALILVAVIVVIAYLTIGVVITEAPLAASYPYTTTYQVFFPASQQVTIGNAEIIAIPVDNRVTLSINKEPSEMGVGETKTISERRAMISALFVRILDFDFRIDATYRGRSGDTTEFYLAFKTSRQVPSFLIERLLPATVQARPV